MRPRDYKPVEFAPELVIAGAEVREVAGFPEHRVSDTGRVWSWFMGRHWKELSQYRQKKGYMTVGLTRDGVQRSKWVHRLVLEAFVGMCPPGMECRHFPDRDRSNNFLSNLQWGTPEENNNDKIAHGTWIHGEAQWKAKLRSSDIQSVRDRYAAGESISSIARSLGVSRTGVGHVVHGRTWKHA